MAKEFIITEGDIDSVVDSLLAEAPAVASAFERWLQSKLDNIKAKIEAGENVQKDVVKIKRIVGRASTLSDEQKQEAISKIERLVNPRFKEKEADIEVYDWGSTKGKGGVSVVDGFKYKGSSKNTTSKKFIEMYINNKIATALLKNKNKGDNLDLTEGEYNKSDFFDKFILPKDASEWENLVYTAKMFDEIDVAEKAEKTKEDGGLTPEQKRELEEKEREAKAKFDNLASTLARKKEALDQNPDLAGKFNSVREDYSTEMKTLFMKRYAEEIATPPTPIPESLQEGYLHNITIDFSEIRRKQKHLDESFLVMFGSWVQWLLGKMFDGGSIPGTIKGSKSEVESFARAMGSEKRYIETAKRYGLDHPTTYKNKAKLSSATKSFEKATGIKWPFE